MKIQFKEMDDDDNKVINTLSLSQFRNIKIKNIKLNCVFIFHNTVEIIFHKVKK